MGERDDAYVYDQAYLWLAGAGVAVIMVALVLGAFLGVEAGGLFAQDAAARAADREALGTLEAFGAWNPVLALTGAALLMAAVIAVLQRIISTIKLRGRAMTATLPTLLTPEEH